MAKEKLISYVKTYKYVALVVLVGVVLMLLPSRKPGYSFVKPCNSMAFVIPHRFLSFST